MTMHFVHSNSREYNVIEHVLFLWGLRNFHWKHAIYVEKVSYTLTIFILNNHQLIINKLEKLIEIQKYN